VEKGGGVGLNGESRGKKREHYIAHGKKEERGPTSITPKRGHPRAPDDGEKENARKEKGPQDVDSGKTSRLTPASRAQEKKKVLTASTVSAPEGGGIIRRKERNLRGSRSETLFLSGRSSRSVTTAGKIKRRKGDASCRSAIVGRKKKEALYAAKFEEKKRGMRRGKKSGRKEKLLRR